MSTHRFPFGEYVVPVVQQDRTPKRVFVLGVYASAVHARWIGPTGRTVVHALAVASEPKIFWRGEGTAEILGRIPVPTGVGRLVDADVVETRFNGPSGRALDDLFLAPLGLSRNDAWLCDLLPESRCNDRQAEAIRLKYEPYVKRGVLPPTDVPRVPSQLASPARQMEILQELRESQSSLLVLLGDPPVQHFLAAFEPRWRKSSDFGNTRATYGRLHRVMVGGLGLDVLPLVHPRQAAGLGPHDPQWRELHTAWCADRTPSVFDGSRDGDVPLGEGG